MRREQILPLLGCVGWLVLGAALGGRAAENSEETESRRSEVKFAAVHSEYSVSVPWDQSKPAIRVPFRIGDQESGQAIFTGHVKNTDQAGIDVIGGDLTIYFGSVKRFFRDLWKERLAEVGTVKMPHGRRSP